MIVIGGSLGSYVALGQILPKLPSNLPLPIALALHRHKESQELVGALLRESNLPVVEVDDKEPILPSRIYLCPPDYHLLVDDGCFSLSTDDLVSFARPSIDVLFESAAEWLGKRVIGVVLSGAGSDGANGVKAIAAKGGTVIVQDPSSAEGPWMPTAAIAATTLSEVRRPVAIARRLVELAAGARTLA